MCPNCNAKNALPTQGDPKSFGNPKCAKCGTELFPIHHQNAEKNKTQSLSKLFICYLKGATIGAIIALVPVILLLSPAQKNFSIAFLDVHAGSLFTVIVYSFINGDAQKYIKKAEGNYLLLLVILIPIAGIAPIANWLVAMPFLFLFIPFIDQIYDLIPGLSFIYGGANMLGFYLLFKPDSIKNTKQT